MYMKAPKQKKPKHAKIEIKKFESQKIIINYSATMKMKAKAIQKQKKINNKK